MPFELFKSFKSFSALNYFADLTEETAKADVFSKLKVILFSNLKAIFSKRKGAWAFVLFYAILYLGVPQIQEIIVTLPNTGYLQKNVFFFSLIILSGILWFAPDSKKETVKDSFAQNNNNVDGTMVKEDEKASIHNFVRFATCFAIVWITYVSVSKVASSYYNASESIGKWLLLGVFIFIGYIELQGGLERILNDFFEKQFNKKAIKQISQEDINKRAHSRIERRNFSSPMEKEASLKAMQQVVKKELIAEVKEKNKEKVEKSKNSILSSVSWWSNSLTLILFILSFLLF